MRRALIFLILLACCMPTYATAASEKLILEQYFRGVTTGRGTFTIPISGVRRDFTLTARGTWNGRVLTLVEDFVFSDGERDRKTWRFERVAPGRYIGTREDVIGTADVFQDGNAVRLRYRLTVPGRDGSRTELGFDDIMTVRADGTLLNEATVSFLGLPIGSTVVEFRRAPGR